MVYCVIDFRFLDDYMVQISNMVRFNKSTVYVNFQHLQEVK